MKNYSKIKMVYKFAQKFMREQTYKQYHNFWHVRDVTHATLRVAGKEGVCEKEKFLLITATLLHDLIVEPGNEYNEEQSADLSEQTLFTMGYSLEEVCVIKRLILATKVPTNPKNKIEEIICDADTDNLGREDFFERGEEIRKELGVPEGKAWYEKQLQFLKHHKYYTKAAQSLRNYGLRNNIEQLERILRGDTKC